MVETEFSVTYDGQALSDGEMRVGDLAPSLLALGELFTEASLVAHPDREPVSLNIRATTKGSFAVELILSAPKAWDQIMQLLSGPASTALTNLQQVVFGAGGLLWLVKAINRRKIRSVENADPGLIRITLVDGTVLEAKPEALALYQQLSARESARKVVEPLHRTGIETVEFSEGDTRVFAIEKADLPAYDAVEPDEEPVDDREEELVVTVATAALIGGYKWRLSEGDNVFTASLDDPLFRSRIDAGEAFRKGDMLRVRMRIIQTQRGDKLQVERTILEVVEHLPRKMQMDIDSELADSQ